ncbi:hypothetical protein FH972_021293 [Carpinus fangiana]|uniref:BZIP domain-containing protein n=1 Tax=Carpinus fangiana TaxID=176857 RepID=A0A5N6KPH5_9ROSI|nr:hypothetical protein FH972_021293 [Carpinus fangiana]
MSEPIKTPKKPNRNSEYRTAQNRLAQRRYRARQKQRWEDLQAAAAGAVSNASASATPQQNTAPVPRTHPVPVRPRVVSAADAERLRPLFSRLQQVMSAAPSESVAAAIANSSNVTPEQYTAIDPGNFDGVSGHHSSDPFVDQSIPGDMQMLTSSILYTVNDYESPLLTNGESFPSTTMQPTPPITTHTTATSTHPIPLHAIFTDPLTSSYLSPLASTSPSTSHTVLPASHHHPTTIPTPSRSPTAAPTTLDLVAQLQQHHPYFAPLRPNNLHIHRVNIFVAAAENARHIGVWPPEMKEHTASPFYLAPELLLPAYCTVQASQQFFNFLQPDLQPVAAQITVSHPMWLDTIPLPAFREAVLSHWPVFQAQRDEAGSVLLRELGEDIDNGGMVCWGSTATQGGLGVPWDGRSWEMKPWFVRKWRWMFGLGKGLDEALKGARWWAAMRGEQYET